jgi:hypothetical protein
MGNEFHLIAERLLEQMERDPEAVQAHVASCEACLYVLALVRRASGEPTGEQSEVVVDVLREWTGDSPGPRGGSP